MGGAGGGEEQCFQQMVLGQLDFIPLQKNNFGLTLYHIQKNPKT